MYVHKSRKKIPAWMNITRCPLQNVGARCGAPIRRRCSPEQETKKTQNRWHSLLPTCAQPAKRLWTLASRVPYGIPGCPITCGCSSLAAWTLDRLQGANGPFQFYNQNPSSWLLPVTRMNTRHPSTPLCLNRPYCPSCTQSARPPHHPNPCPSEHATTQAMSTTSQLPPAHASSYSQRSCCPDAAALAASQVPSWRQSMAAGMRASSVR